MIKYLKNLRKRILFGMEWRKHFGMSVGNYKRNDTKLNLLLEYGLNSGVKNVDTKDQHYIYIDFNCGMRAELWDSNKWYAWLSSGTIYFNNEEYRYTGVLPSKEIQLELKKQSDLNKTNMSGDKMMEPILKTIVRKKKLERIIK